MEIFLYLSYISFFMSLNKGWGTQLYPYTWINTLPKMNKSDCKDCTYNVHFLTCSVDKVKSNAWGTQLVHDLQCPDPFSNPGFIERSQGQCELWGMSAYITLHFSGGRTGLHLGHETFPDVACIGFHGKSHPSILNCFQIGNLRSHVGKLRWT